MKVFDNLKSDIVCSPVFKEDSVREEIIAPLLKALGYSAFCENAIIRSKKLEHPYIAFGTKRENITMIPDYLVQVQRENKFIIDAKAPTENIFSGKHVEQAFSYAIHREVRVNIYALCNGIDLVIYHVNQTSPVYQIKIDEIENRWDEIYSILSPIAFLKPYLSYFLPDFGIRLLNFKRNQDCKFNILGAKINCLGKMNEEFYTFSCEIPFESQCIGSFDFHKSLLGDFIIQIPDDMKDGILAAINNSPFYINFPSGERLFEVFFECEISSQIVENDDEIYCPLIVTKFYHMSQCDLMWPPSLAPFKFGPTHSR